MMVERPATARIAAMGRARGALSSRAPRAPPFDAEEFEALREMIGHDGVIEMVEIFETETRQRLRRLAAGNRDRSTLVREMHTLKGAAGTVGAPRLAALGRMFEQAAHRGIFPTPDDLDAIAMALDAFLAAVTAVNERRSVVA